MLVRRASAEDTRAIHAIAQSLYVNRPDFELKYGFIVYYLDDNEYRLRIYNNPFYVVVADGRIVGFLMAYNSPTIKNYLEKGLISHEDRIFKNIFAYCKVKNITEFIFIDQIAVAPEFQKKICGGLLLKRFCKDTNGPYFGAILREPYYNPNEKFFLKRNFKEISEVEIKSDKRWPVTSGEGDLLKLKWGIYMAERITFRAHPKG